MCTDSQFIFTIQLLLNSQGKGISLNSYMPFIFREKTFRRLLLAISSSSMPSTSTNRQLPKAHLLMQVQFKEIVLDHSSLTPSSSPYRFHSSLTHFYSSYRFQDKVVLYHSSFTPSSSSYRSRIRKCLTTAPSHPPLPPSDSRIRWLLTTAPSHLPLPPTGSRIR